MLAAPALVIGYLQRFVRGEGFRAEMEQMIEARLGGQARLADLVWHDDAATMSEASIHTATGLQIEATGLRAALDFSAIRRGSWSIQGAAADELTLTKHPAPATAPRTILEDDATAALPAWIQRHIPKITEVDGFDAERFTYTHGAWQIAESRLHLGSYNSAAAGQGRFSIPGSLDDGTLAAPLTPPNQKEPLKLDITRAAFRVTDDRLHLIESTLRWKERSQVELRGSLKFIQGDWQVALHATQVPVGEFLTADWQPRLSGHLEGDLEMSGSPGQPVVWKADAALKGGVLTALPLLDKLATYTRMDRFKRLALDIATASLRPQNGGMHLEKIIVQSNGLMRIEGTLTLLPGDAIDGQFMVGVTPETLRWLPGAQNRVFIESYPQGPPGLNWARVKVAGTRAAPQEDLSSRLLGAAGMSLLLDTPGTLVDKASDTLLKPILGQDAAKLPGQLLNDTTRTLEQGVKTGTDLLNKVIPIFPGK